MLNKDLQTTLSSTTFLSWQTSMLEVFNLSLVDISIDWSLHPSFILRDLAASSVPPFNLSLYYDSTLRLGELLSNSGWKQQ